MKEEIVGLPSLRVGATRAEHVMEYTFLTWFFLFLFVLYMEGG